MHCKNSFFLLLIFSINAFSFEEGFAKNKSIDIAYRDYGPKNAPQGCNLGPKFPTHVKRSAKQN